MLCIAVSPALCTHTHTHTLTRTPSCSNAVASQNQLIGKLMHTSTVVVLPSSDAVFHSHAVYWSVHVHTLFFVTNYVLMCNVFAHNYNIYMYIPPFTESRGCHQCTVWIWDFGLFKRKHNVDDSYIIQITDV